MTCDFDVKTILSNHLGTLSTVQRDDFASNILIYSGQLTTQMHLINNQILLSHLHRTQPSSLHLIHLQIMSLIANNKSSSAIINKTKIQCETDFFSIADKNPSNLYSFQFQFQHLKINDKYVSLMKTIYILFMHPMYSVISHSKSIPSHLDMIDGTSMKSDQSTDKIKHNNYNNNNKIETQLRRKSFNWFLTNDLR